MLIVRRSFLASSSTRLNKSSGRYETALLTRSALGFLDIIGTPPP